MDIRQVIQSQYLAALAMLKQAIVSCPQPVWDSPDDKFKFWSKAYHTVFFVHFYLQDAEKDFVEWEKHHDPDGDIPFTKEEVLEYFKESTTDSIDEALKELGGDEYTEQELRIMRIKFYSEFGN